MIVEYDPHGNGGSAGPALRVPTTEGRFAGYWRFDTPGRFRPDLAASILPVMSGFVVDARSLLAVRDALDRLHEELLTMHTVIYGFWGTLGGHELEGELEHFCGTWHYGVIEVADQVAGLMTGLARAAAAYERIDRRLASHGGSGSGTTVIGGGGSKGGGSGSGSGSGSGTTVIGGGGGGSGSGSGTTVIGAAG